VPPATFTPIENLAFFAFENADLHTEVENFKTSVYIPISAPDDEVQLNLYDETGVSKTFKPLQFHIHAPSEHTINGKNYDLEVHIVHANSDKSMLSVIGIMFDMKAGGN
jgi:carbonic anhydrase